MRESLLIVSGLLKETEAQASLVGAINELGVNARFAHLSDCEQVLFDHVYFPVIVLLLPILGDNDLIDRVQVQLAHFVSNGRCRECAFVVISCGDRHLSDEFIKPDLPFTVKVRRLFSAVGILEILGTKLDKFTASTLAHELLELVDAIKPSDLLELNRIAGFLQRAPKWTARERLLDFYDPFTGDSLLKSVGLAVQKRIAFHIHSIAPKVLKITHACLTDDVLGDLDGTLKADAIDLGSNSFSWGGIMSKVGSCRWLGFAANDIDKVHISQLPTGLEHLYLHKNALDEFIVEKNVDIALLKSLSLYRNLLTTFDWPAGQTTLTRLNLGANPISSLPDTLSDCVKLEFIGLAKTQISSLPEWIFTLKKLRELDISYIEDRIPPAQIAHLHAQGVSLITRPGLVIS